MGLGVSHSHYFHVIPVTLVKLENPFWPMSSSIYGNTNRSCIWLFLESHEMYGKLLCVCVCAHSRENWKTTLGAIPQEPYICFVFESRRLVDSNRSGLAGQWSPGSPVSASPAWTLSEHHHIWLLCPLKGGFWETNSGPCVSKGALLCLCHLLSPTVWTCEAF